MITLTENPTDYNLPYPSWYENQRGMVEKTVNLSPGQVLILEAPTGVGKSGAPLTVSYHRPGTTVCVATRDLQQQYADISELVKVAWGQEHYPCVNEEHITQFARAYNESPTRADCPFRRGAKDCSIGAQCPYEQSKIQALEAQAKVLNYALAFYTKWWRPYTNDLFCDEAHRLPGILSSLVSLEVANRTRKWYDLPDFPYASGGTSYAYGQIQSWAKKGARHLKSHEGAVGGPKMKLRVRRMRLKLEGLVRMLDKAEPGTWYVASGQSVGKLMAKPIFPGRYAKTILDENARSITLMSATIGDPALLAEELGLAQDFEFLSLPHIFPKENRVIIWVKESPRLSRKSTADDYRAQAEIIARILNSHRGQKGLIHTVSWKHTELLKDLLGRTHGHRLYVPKGEERVKAVERFKNSNGDTVVISPSWYEGLNFPDDEARFAIIAKVPYLSLADPVVKLRLKSKGGGRWYRWQAALRIVQAAGRVVRHRDDWAVCYICDSEWPRVAKYTPQWFEVTNL